MGGHLENSLGAMFLIVHYCSCILTAIILSSSSASANCSYKHFFIFYFFSGPQAVL